MAGSGYNSGDHSKGKKMRKSLIAGNWKMNLGRADQALTFVRQIRFPLNQIEGVERVICPPFTVLAAIAEILRPTRIQLGAQTVHWESKGAYTGEIAPSMLVGLCDYVIIGHSERRTGLVAFPDESMECSVETDEAVNRKVRAALDHGLKPIICVGENLAQNREGLTDTFVGGQVDAALSGLTAAQVQSCVIAYEPIWAIGTGEAATPAGANSVIGLTIRGVLADLFGEQVAQALRVLYGGSVNTNNIAAFMAMPEIDGALVGGASLKPDFVELVRIASGL
jgi:triosephosphate isomerase